MGLGNAFPFDDFGNLGHELRFDQHLVGIGVTETWAALARLEGTIDDAAMRRMNAAAELDGKDFAAVAASFLTRQPGTPVSAGTSAKVGGFDDFWRKLFGPDFGRLTLEHLGLVFLSLAASIVIGIPLGILAVKRPATEGLIIGATGVVQTIPSLALLAILIPLTGRIGAVPAYIARSPCTRYCPSCAIRMRRSRRFRAE